MGDSPNLTSKKTQIFLNPKPYFSLRGNMWLGSFSRVIVPGVGKGQKMGTQL